MLVSDGVLFDEVHAIIEAFHEEYAEVFVTSPHSFLAVRTVVAEGVAGPDLTTDFPIDLVNREQFDGLILPSGTLSVDLLRRDERVQAVICHFHERQLPIFAAGEASCLLQESGILAPNIFVREGDEIDLFMQNAIAMLLDSAPAYSVVKGG